MLVLRSPAKLGAVHASLPDPSGSGGNSAGGVTGFHGTLGVGPRSGWSGRLEFRDGLGSLALFPPVRLSVKINP